MLITGRLTGFLLPQFLKENDDAAVFSQKATDMLLVFQAIDQFIEDEAILTCAFDIAGRSHIDAGIASGNDISVFAEDDSAFVLIEIAETIKIAPNQMNSEGDGENAEEKKHPEIELSHRVIEENAHGNGSGQKA